MKKCKKCGSTQFIVSESLTHKAELDQKTETLEAYTNQSNEIEEITCRECGEEYQPSDFKNVTFNY